MKKNYKIIEFKLTPITPFFFGKENASDLGNKNDYFQTSQEYPQQTTLLGFLRHKILRDNNINLDANKYSDIKNESNNLVGTEGFIINNGNIKDYGKVHSLSPCFVIDESGEYLWERNKERIQNKGKEETLCINKNLNGFIWEDTIQNHTTLYLTKHFFSSKLNDTAKDDLMNFSNYVGSYKGGNKQQIKEDSFYIMEYRHLQKKKTIATIKDKEFSKPTLLSFGFLACIEEDCHISTLPDFMPMGKERSIFKVEINILETGKQLEISEEFDYQKGLKIQDDDNEEILMCVLLSDAKVSKDDFEELNKLTLMQITEQQRLRYIKRKTGLFHTAARPLKESKAFNLIAKGSVLFLRKAEKVKIEAVFHKSKDFRQIGYNYVMFINAKTI